MVIVYLMIFGLMSAIPPAVVGFVDGIIEFRKEMREHDEYRRNDKR